MREFLFIFIFLFTTGSSIYFFVMQLNDSYLYEEKWKKILFPILAFTAPFVGVLLLLFIGNAGSLLFKYLVGIGVIK